MASKLKKAFLRTGLLQPFTVNGSFKMYFCETLFGERFSWTSLGKLLDRHWDPRETAELQSFMKEGMVGLDIGANVGYYSLLMAQKCEKVYAFEPQPKVFSVLRRNIRINGLENRILPCMAGAYDKNTELEFDGVEIDVLRLDDFFSGLRKPDLVKLDVDGEEIAVIDGGVETFANAKLVLYEDMTYDGKVGESLRKLGFETTRLNSVNCIARKS